MNKLGIRRSSAPKRLEATEQRARAPFADGVPLQAQRVGLSWDTSIEQGAGSPRPTPRRRSNGDVFAQPPAPDQDMIQPSHSLRRAISGKTTSGRNFSEVTGKFGAKHSYDLNETVAFAAHINHCLKDQPLVSHLLPLDASGEDLFAACSDGLLLCCLVNLASPGSIDMSKVNPQVEGEEMGVYRTTENCNLAIDAAVSAGIMAINIGAQDIIEGKPTIILSLVWQLIRVQLLAQVNVKHIPDLIHLIGEEEDEEAFFQQSAEEIMLRWFNHHLEWADYPVHVSDFTTDLMDGKCYVALMQELNDRFNPPVYPDGDPASPFKRAREAIDAAEEMGVFPLIRAGHIVRGSERLNVAFVAQLVNRRPRIHRVKFHEWGVLRIQAWCRMVAAVRLAAPLRAERRVAAAVVKRAWQRTLLDRKEKVAAKSLQAWTRGVCTRRATAALLRRRAMAAVTLRRACTRKAQERIKGRAAVRLQGWGRDVVAIVAAQKLADAERVRRGLRPRHTRRARRRRAARTDGTVWSWGLRTGDWLSDVMEGAGRSIENAFSLSYTPPRARRAPPRPPARRRPAAAAGSSARCATSAAAKPTTRSNRDRTARRPSVAGTGAGTQVPSSAAAAYGSLLVTATTVGSVEGQAVRAVPGGGMDWYGELKRLPSYINSAARSVGSNTASAQETDGEEEEAELDTIEVPLSSQALMVATLLYLFADTALVRGGAGLG